MKSGRSEAGSRAAVSHTGSLAGSDRIYNNFFKQTGIVRADDYDEIISFSKLHLSGKIPAGKNTVIITSSGGRGINEADRCEAYGLNVIKLKEETQTAISKRIPNFASATNPIDLTAAASVTNPELFIEPLKDLIHDPEVHNIILTEFPTRWGPDSDYLKEFIEICKKTDKFIFISLFPIDGMEIPDCIEELEKNGIPVITDNLNPIRSLAKLVNYSEKRQKFLENKSVKQASLEIKNDISHLFSTGYTLSESQACAVIEAYGIKTAKKAVTVSESEASSTASDIGFPVVMKIDTPDIPHKTEAEAIKLNIHSKNEAEEIKLNVNSEKEVELAFDEIMTNAKNYNPEADIHGVSVQQMLPEGVEVICGVSNDPIFGPVLMFGLGGVFVEVFKDISLRIAPLSYQEALDMIQETKGYEILKGTRGKTPVDIDAIIDVLMKLSSLASDYSDQIQELDINPLIVYENGAIAADAMISLKENKDKKVIGG